MNLNTNWPSEIIKTIKDWWPVVKSNFQQIQTAFNSHVDETGEKHSANAIINDSDEYGSSVKDALDNNKLRIDGHIGGTSGKHTAQSITYLGSFTSKNDVKAALDEAKRQIDEIVINASIDPEVALARQSSVKSKTFTTLDTRLEETEQDIIDLADSMSGFETEEGAQGKANAAKEAANLYTDGVVEIIQQTVTDLQEEFESHSSDNEYQNATISGTQIRITRQSNTKRLFFYLLADLTGGNITISLDGGTTSLMLKDIDGNQITSLSKGYQEVVENTDFFTLRSRGGDDIGFFGKFMGMPDTNLCIGGVPLSGGDNTSYPKGNAFDGSISTAWMSSQTTTAIPNNAFIGYDFGAGQAKVINQIKVAQYADSAYTIATAKFQGSNDGTNWADVQTVTLIKNADLNTYAITNTTAYRYYRLLAASQPTGGSGWCILSFEMFDLTLTAPILIPKVQKDSYVYSNEDVQIGTITYGTDIATSAQAISSSDNTYYGTTKANAFNNNWDEEHGWLSGASVNGWIGQDFGVGILKNIRKIRVRQKTYIQNSTSSALIEYSNNGSDWTLLQAAPLQRESSIINDIILNHNVYARFWRLRNPVDITGAWGVIEVEMMEIASGQWIPSINNATSETQLKATVTGELKTYGTALKRYTGVVSKKSKGWS